MFLRQDFFPLREGCLYCAGRPRSVCCASSVLAMARGNEKRFCALHLFFLHVAAAVRRMALVAYSDSEEEEAPRRSALPPLDLAPAGYQNEWLSYAFLPGTFSPDAVPIDRALRDLLRRSCPPSWTLLPVDDALHISLTRPIVLRKHEESLFTQCVSDAVRASGVRRYVSMLTQLLGGLCALCVLCERHLASRLSLAGDQCGVARDGEPHPGT